MEHLKRKISLIFLCALLFPEIGWGYEGMIRHGYFSCVACHNSTSGGGNLSDYGKVISSSFSFFKGKEFEDSKPSWIKKLDPSLQLRLAHINRGGDKRTFPMQADLLTKITISEKSNLLATIAKAPKSRSKSESSIEDQWYVRRFLYTHIVKDNLHLELGRSNPPFGIYDPDHKTYVRSFNRRETLDLPSQISLTFYGEKNRHSIYVLLPSYQEVKENREYAVAAKEEFYLKGLNTLIGVDFLVGRTQKIHRYLVGSYIKSFYKNWLLLSEFNFTHRESDGSDENLKQAAFFLKTSYFVKDYWELYISREGLIQRSSSSSSLSSDRKRSTIGTLFKLSKNSSFIIERKAEDENKLYLAQLFFNIW